MPVDYVMTPARPGAGGHGDPVALAASPGELALRAEREFLTRCLSSGAVGQDYLARPTDDQFSSDLLRRARDHLVRHFDDPLAGLPEDDPGLSALVTDVALASQERPSSEELVLRMSMLQLEQRRIDREIRRASQDGDHARKTELAAAEQRVRDELGSVMGQTA